MSIHGAMLYNRAMQRVLVAVGLLGMSACTKPNPAAMCINGACLDPDFPFCDTTGDVGGVPGACTEAPDCTPSTVACANGTLTMCDDTGTVSNVETCALGCEDQFDACKQFVPANDIQQFVDMVANPVDLTFDQGRFFTEDNLFSPDTGADIPLNGILVPAPPGGTALLVVVGKHITLGTASVHRKVTEPSGTEALGPALVFYATEGIEVTGRLQVLTGVGDITCNGQPGEQKTVTSGKWISGGGGGGHAMTGGAGGDVQGTPIAHGGVPGGPSGTQELVPLRGGCRGGGLFFGNPAPGGTGGGSIQLSSLTGVHIAGTIVADGQNGIHGGDGGGGGGGILIDAPDVTVDMTAKLLVRGGPGSSGGAGSFIPAEDDGQPILGEGCDDGTGVCGDGGDGASALVGPKDGHSVTATTTTNFAAGGGGGGLGRIRVNTKTGDFQPPINAVFAGAFTAGTIGTK